MKSSDFEEMDNGSTINTLWRDFSNFYQRRKQGLRFGYERVAGKMTVWFTFHKKF